MELKKFRIQNYKKIDDTGWISCDNFTAFVGKNESGKSAIFRGFSKLNPSDGEKYDGLKEFPRRRYTAEFKQKDWIASSAEFELSKEEQVELAKISPLLKNVPTILCSRFYSNKLKIEFIPSITAVTLTVKGLIEAIKKLEKQTETVVVSEGRGEQLAPLKTNLLSYFQTKNTELAKQDSSTPVPENLVNEVCTTISSQINEDWQKETFQKVLEEKSRLQEQIQAKQELDEAEKLIKKHMPQFLYLDKYDVIDSAIHIGNFVQQLKQDPNNPRLRTTNCLFDHVGLEPEFLLQLDPNTPNETEEQLRRWADERSINLSSASATMTKKFSDWWEQRKHKFRYDIDSQFFRVWVSDDLDPSEIELDQRSAGMQYFFSFYLIFLVESEKGHKNSILLLDEPGLHYHGTAQMKTVQFLRKLSKKNQLLYTTQSPFMIDGDHLEDVKVVYENEKTGYTQVSDDVWPNDKDSIFPLQAALGYTIAQTLFYSKKQMVVEGITDFSILKAMNELLTKKGMTSLNKDIIITPSGGIRNMMPLASMLLGNDVRMAILLDADQPAIQKQKEMKEKLLLDCILINSITDTKKVEIEDLFPEKLYLDAVKQQYQDVDLSFTDEEQKIIGISKRVQALFDRLGKSFEKWEPVNVLVDWIHSDKPGEHQMPQQTCKYFESIFKEVIKKLA